MNCTLRRAKSGFTLVETLIVITILVILAALLFPVFRSGVDSSKRSVTISRLKQMYQAMLMYGGDYDVYDEAPGLGSVPAFPLEMVTTLAPYGVKGEMLHSAVFPDVGKVRFGTSFTYYWVTSYRTIDGQLTPEASKNRATLLEQGSNFVIVSDMVHDYFEFWPHERGSDPYMQRRYEINLRVNGSVKPDRRPGIRGSILPYWKT